ncbi:MAG: HAD family hydrolase [Mariniblastus sp.]
MSQTISVALFDAVGTVIYPDPGVIDVYLKLGEDHGSDLTRQQVKDRITIARRKYFNVGVAGNRDGVPSLDSSEVIEFALWKRLVLDVFAELESADILFDELWSHFADPNHWRLYDDVADCWGKLREHGVAIGLASNFDSRLIRICDSMELLSDIEFVFCSSQVGFRKPCQNFYRQVEAMLASQLGPGRLQVAMVGDDLENDCVAPAFAGWQSVWLNRKSNPSSVEESSELDSSVHQVATATEFADWAIKRFANDDVKF